MSRIAYVNGQYVPHRVAAVHIEDRGYQFADGVYEVCEIRNHQIIDQTRHLNRLDRSLSELEINWPVQRSAISVIMREVARRNKVVNGLIYIQVTRGVAARDHMFPPSDTPAALVLTAKSVPKPAKNSTGQSGIDVITVPENRWERVDIKTVGLLPNVLAREKARRANATEAIFVDQAGNITEGSATNIWIISAENELITRPADRGILRGITRQAVVDIAATLGLTLRERPFTVTEARQAKEAFLTSATKTVKPVVRIDGVSIGNGNVGELTERLYGAFYAHTEHSTPFTKNF